MSSGSSTSQSSSNIARMSSSDASIDEMTDQFHNWLALSPRAVEPSPSVDDGEFDFDSAQLHDVRRHVDELGEITYIFVLLDAQGRTHEMSLNEEEGKIGYELMQRVKANPLLEKLYRQIVMPLLDRLIQGEGE